jgi:heparanase 1
MDALGTLAQLQHKVHCRQTLVGGSYEVIAKDIFEPNPDYWVAVLWKRLMGTKVFETTVAGATHLRAYSHCDVSGNGVTVVLINLAHDVTYEISVEGLSGTMTPRVEYYLTSDGLQSQRIKLNGVELQLTDNDQLPPLTGRVVTSDSVIKMAPLSYGFVNFPSATSSHC